MFIEYGSKDAAFLNKCGKSDKMCLYKGVAGHAAATAAQSASRELLHRYKRVNDDMALTLSDCSIQLHNNPYCVLVLVFFFHARCSEICLPM